MNIFKRIPFFQSSYLFSSFVVSNPRTGQVSYQNDRLHGVAEMENGKKMLQETRKIWNKLSVEEKKNKLTAFL